MNTLKLKDILLKIDRNTPISVFDEFGLITNKNSVLAGDLGYRDVADYLDNYVREIKWNEDDHCIDIELFPFDTSEEDI